LISKTKQRSYEWRGSFATAAIAAIQDFWDSDLQYASAENRADFVEWAIPAKDEEPSPFTWASIDETDSDNIVSASPLCATHTNGYQVYKGSFQSPAILATFGAHLASISHLPSNLLIDDAPEGALSMSTTSVCRSFIANQTY
jgi:hypothetical protein